MSPSSEYSAESSENELALDDLIGTVYVGRYELNSVLGTGGMGVIYRGRQVFLDRPVAVKLLKSNSISSKARMRFHQEAKAASALSHPGIVSIIDFGVDELDRPYMAMEFVEGCTLTELLAERIVLSLEDALPVFLEACDALGAAHKKGIVHRDIKPSNIMLVVSDDGEVHIKLLDFGIAKMLDFPEHTLQDLTKTGDTLGTPLYMSPEQINSKNVTYRSDLYSLGCTMYACLTGAPPFVGQTKMETMEMHCHDRPMTLEEASDGLKFPSELEAIVQRLLAKNPSERFESAEQLKRALVTMAEAIAKQAEAVGSGTSLFGWSSTSTGMSKVVSESVHSSMAGRARLAPSNVANPLTSSKFGLRAADSSERENNESIFWSSDLSDRIERASSARADWFGARKPSKSKGPKSLELGESRFPKGVRVAAVICALLSCGIGLFYMQTGISSQAVKKLPVSSTAPSSVLPQHLDSAPASISEVFPSVDLTTADMLIDKTISKTPMVQSLSLEKMDGLSEKGLARLSALKSLRRLNLSETGITIAGLRIVSALNLQSLVLDDNSGISDAGLFYVGSMDSLEHLSLAKTSISDVGLRHLAKLSKLKALILAENGRISDLGIRNLNPAESKLASLSVENCNVDDAAVEDLLKFGKLRNVVLSGNSNITTACVRPLAQSQRKWRGLGLAHLHLSARAVESLARIDSLELLDISGSYLNEKAIAALCKMPNLTDLYLSTCDLTDAEKKTLHDSLRHTRLDYTHTLCHTLDSFFKP
ncbi:MAG: protein kinase [Cyanobacteria bacterium SZAS TMP-1]|nr:protein kinase [Cyanobacteria bacterium SZAS TMP-1]